MPVTLIEQNPSFTKKVEGEDKLAIAELFGDTLQGEGIYTGFPATFLRLQGCTLSCKWCDTLEVWPNGNEYSFDEVLDLMEGAGLIQKMMKNRQHLILTGGSPLKQQARLVRFLARFYQRFGFRPFIEVENEAVLMPDPILAAQVSCWNNSPKLANSGMKTRVRIKPEVLIAMSQEPNSWFKFVIEGEGCWNQIVDEFLTPGYIQPRQIILMPQGQDQKELNVAREIAADVAIRHGVRFSDRMHITIWNKKVGV